MALSVGVASSDNCPSRPVEPRKAGDLDYSDPVIIACQFRVVITAPRPRSDGQKDPNGQDCDNDRASQKVEE